MEVVWSEEAAHDLAALYASLAEGSPESAERWAERVLQRTEQLASFPEMGRMVPEFGSALLRELIEGPYRIIYERYPDRVAIVAVAHGRQMLLPPG